MSVDPRNLSPYVPFRMNYKSEAVRICEQQMKAWKKIEPTEKKTSKISKQPQAYEKTKTGRERLEDLLSDITYGKKPIDAQSEVLCHLILSRWKITLDICPCKSMNSKASLAFTGDQMRGKNYLAFKTEDNSVPSSFSQSHCFHAAGSQKAK